MTKNKLIELAQVGMGIHSPNQPEYIVCEALIKALAQSEQEPVAWRYRMPVEDGHFVWNYATYIDDPKDQRCEPLYIIPPQRTWVGLTEAQCGVLWKTNMTPFEYYQAIEVKLKEKNT